MFGLCMFLSKLTQNKETTVRWAAALHIHVSISVPDKMTSPFQYRNHDNLSYHIIENLCGPMIDCFDSLKKSSSITINLI